MSEENVEIVRRMYEAYFRGDFETALSAFAEDVVWEDMNGTYQGRDGVVEATTRWTGAWDDLRQELEDIRDAEGGDVVVALRQSGRGKGSGVWVQTVTGWIYMISGGEISRVRLFTDPATAMQAAGLSE